MNGLQLVAATRTRLLISATLGMLPTLGIAIWGTAWIRESSTSGGTDLLIIVSWMLLALGEGALLSLLTGDFMFGERWRRMNLLGERDLAGDDDFARAASSAQSASGGAVAAMGLMVIIGAVTGALIAIAPNAKYLFALGLVALIAVVVAVVRGRGKTPDAEAELAAATRPRTATLAVLTVAFTLTLVLGVDSASGDFLNWYSRVGYATSTLRGDDEAAKIAILKQMTRAQDDRLIELTTMMEAQAFGPDTEPAVRIQALWSLGEVCRRMVRSVELMEQGNKGGAWVNELLPHLRAEVEPRLIALLRAGATGDQGRAVVYGVGALRSPAGLVELAAALDRESTDREMVRGIILAFSEYRWAEKVVPLLLPSLAGSDPELAGLSAWAIGENYGMGTGDADEVAPDPGLVQLLAQRLPEMELATQCMVLDALIRVRSEELNETLFLLFDVAAPPDVRCPRQLVEKPFRSAAVASREEELREKVIQALAAVAEGNSAVLSWLTRRYQDPDVADGLRADMKYIIDVLQERPSH